MTWNKGYIDESYWFAATEDVEAEAKRCVWDLLRAQEHVTIPFLLCEKVPFDEAWCTDLTMGLRRWRANPAAIDLWLSRGTTLDWRPNEMTPEDFYAA
jgi:hypothetical protein